MEDVQTASPVIPVSEDEAFSVVNYFHVFTDSRSGRRVAYTRFPDGPHEEQRGDAEVVVCDPDGGAQQVVGRTTKTGQHRGACPTWIDDDRLLYEDTGRGTVCVVEVESGSRREMAGGLDNYSRVLDRVYFSDVCDGEPAVWWLDLASGERHVAVTMAKMQSFAASEGYTFGAEALAHAYITPSGHRIAFRVGREHECVIILADPDGDNLAMFGRKMMHWTFYDDDSFFGHDDVYEKDRHMRRWDLSGNAIETLSGPGCHGTVSPDGGWVVTESWYGSDPVVVFLYRRGETEPTCVLARSRPPWSTRAHVHPSFSRDGRSVIFNHNPDGCRGSVVSRVDLTPWVGTA